MDKAEIENLIRELVDRTLVKTTKITVSDEGASNTLFSVEVTEPHFFVGGEGEALHALNHLVRKIVESRMGGEKSEGGVLVDINGFQRKRIENIRAIAHMMGERARYFKSNIEVDPMSAYERRIVHEFLSGASDLKTESVGFGPSRRVVIKYIGGI